MSTYGRGISWLTKSLRRTEPASLEGLPRLPAGTEAIGKITRAGLCIRALRQALRSGEVKFDDPVTRDLAITLLDKLELFERRMALGAKAKGVTKLVLHRDGSITVGT